MNEKHSLGVVVDCNAKIPFKKLTYIHVHVVMETILDVLENSS